MRCVDDVEQKLAHADGDSARRQLAKVTAIRCAIACMQNDLTRAQAYADRALRDLPEDDLGFRPLIYGALGDSYRQHGRWEEAKACYLKALGFPDAPVIRVESAHVFGALADLELRQGHLRDAAGHWSKALAAIQDRENWGRLPLPVIGWVYLRVGELQYERNELAEAWDHLSRGLERAELGGDVRALIAGYVIAGRLKLTEGDVEAAAEYLERARPLLAEAPFPDWTSRFERCQLDLWLAQDRLRTAVAWADETLTAGALEARPESEVAQLALARVLIVKGGRAGPGPGRWRCSPACCRPPKRRGGQVSRSKRWRCGRSPTGRAGTGQAQWFLWNAPCAWPNLKATCASSPTSGTPCPGYCRKPAPGT